MPAFVRRGRDVQVEIGRRKLKVAHRSGSAAEWTTLVDGQLTWDVNKEECVWTLDPANKINVKSKFWILLFKLPYFYV